MQETRQPVVVDGVNFAQLVQFPKILQAVAMGFAPPRLVIGLMMTAVVMFFGARWDAATGPIGAGDDGAGDLGAFAWTMSLVVAGFFQIVASAMALDLAGVAAGLEGLFISLPLTLWDRAPGFATCFGVLLLLVMAIGGGALARMAACEFATGERLRIIDGLNFALVNWWRLLMAPVLPLVIAGLLVLVLMVAGWLFRLPALDLIGGPLYGVALALGFVIAFLVIGYAAGSMMLIPAVACENCDPGDALQRCYAYVLSRPLHLLGYALTALAGLTAGFLVMSLFAVLVLNITAGAVGAWGDSSIVSAAGGYSLFDFDRGAVAPPEMTWHESWAVAWIGLWETLIVGLVVAYVFACGFASTTIIYLLMRRSCDGQETTDIWRPGLVSGSYITVPEPAARAESE